MTFEEYEVLAGTTAVYKGGNYRIIYPALGIAGEAGEVAEKVKKLLRDKNGVVDDIFKEAVKKELGDVLWYLAALSNDLGFSLEEVAKVNLEKVDRRNAEGTVHGDGDDR